MPAAIAAIIGFLIWFAIVIGSVAAWATHVIVCIKAASWVLLIIGAIFFPIGILHGLAVWLGIV